MLEEAALGAGDLGELDDGAGVGLGEEVDEAAALADAAGLADLVAAGAQAGEVVVEALGPPGEVLEAFVAQDNCGALVQIGRSEKQPGLRRAVVEHLSALECTEATDFLLEILNKK